MKTKLTCALAAVLGAAPVWAETRPLAPHVHGVATVQIAQEGGVLAITWDSPAASLLGFEHAPETDEQRRAVDSLRAKLESFSDALSINAEAGCSVTRSEIEVLAEMGDDRHGHHDEHGDTDHDDHDDDKHEHHDEHEHGAEHHDEHDEHGEEHHGEHDEHGDDHEEGSVHSEVNAAWMLNCTAPDELAAIEVLLFEGNTYLETVDAELLLASGPRVQQLTPSDRVLNLR